LINFHVLTLFPDFFKSFSETSMIKKALDKDLFNLNILYIRDKAVNRYGQVDDEPYGGGPGMLLRPEPIIESYNSIKFEGVKKKCIFFSPKGRFMTNEYIINLTNFDNIVLICGHYEGVDDRVIELLSPEEVSIGDFVLTGGELPAMALIDAVARHIDGVLKKDSLNEESFSKNLLEYRQFTRPAEYQGKKVPDVLLSGNHREIEEFRLIDSVRETLKKRPDLIENNKFDEKINKIIKKLKGNKNELS
jgi:tRNA (guanine37-N1)-methyltransferase